MRKISRFTLTLLVFGMLLGACTNPPAPTQDPAVAAATMAAQVEAQVSTRVAQALADFQAAQRAQPTPIPVIPTAASNIPTVAPLNQPTAALPGMPAVAACNATPILLGESVEDGTDVKIGTPFTKSWTIKNMGTCSWNPSYKVKFMSGDSMSGPASQSFGATITPGNSLTINLKLTAPSGTGTYKGVWGFYDDKDIWFGQAWVEIDVVPVVTATSTGFSVEKIKFYQAAPNSCSIAADITVNAAGTVKFQWIEDGAPGNLRTQVLTAAQTFNSSWAMTSGTHAISIYVDTPNRQTFGGTSYTCP
jgi:hypothetical protein